MPSSKYLWKQTHSKKCINNCSKLKEDHASPYRDFPIKYSSGELLCKIQLWLIAHHLSGGRSILALKMGKVLIHLLFTRWAQVGASQTQEAACVVPYSLMTMRKENGNLELARNANSWAPPDLLNQKLEAGPPICVFTSFPGDSDA